MKKVLLLALVILSLNAWSQTPEVRIMCSDEWPPGKMVPLTLLINRGDADGFARFSIDFPYGFTIEPVNSAGADFYVDDRQVNIVWLQLPTDKEFSVTFLAGADKVLEGSFNLSGWFYYINNGTDRLSVQADKVNIKLNPDAVVQKINLPVQRDKDLVDKSPVTENKSVNKRKNMPDVSFSVQLTVSSQLYSEEELEERIQCKLTHKLKTLKTGKLYKYQSGSFPTYDEASAYLADLKEQGLSDAFIIAFRDDVQIAISEARELTEK